MEVVLLENIKNLGKIGDTVKVKRGYARNYLISQFTLLSSIGHLTAKKLDLKLKN